MEFKRDWKSHHPDDVTPFKIENDLPRGLVEVNVHLNEVIGYWRDKGFGDLWKHGERIIYFNTRGERVGEVKAPLGNFPWPDPVLPQGLQLGNRDGCFAPAQRALTDRMSRQSSPQFTRRRRQRRQHGSRPSRGSSHSNPSPNQLPRRVNLRVSQSGGLEEIIGDLSGVEDACGTPAGRWSSDPNQI